MTSKVAVMGPTLLGEMPRGMNGRDPLLEVYLNLVINATKTYNITYIHTRDIFFSKIPPDWREHEGYLTVDGEHPNSAGKEIIRGIYESILNKWFS